MALNEAAKIGYRLRRSRLAAGLSQRDLAEPGVTAAYVSRIEKGERLPSVRAIRRLAAKVGINPYWLETGRRDPAEELARIVLGHRGLPAQARALARKVLEERGLSF